MDDKIYVVEKNLDGSKIVGTLTFENKQVTVESSTIPSSTSGSIVTPVLTSGIEVATIKTGDDESILYIPNDYIISKEEE